MGRLPVALLGRRWARGSSARLYPRHRAGPRGLLGGCGTARRRLRGWRGRTAGRGLPPAATAEAAGSLVAGLPPPPGGHYLMAQPCRGGGAARRPATGPLPRPGFGGTGYPAPGPGRARRGVRRSGDQPEGNRGAALRATARPRPGRRRTARLRSNSPLLRPEPAGLPAATRSPAAFGAVAARGPLRRAAGVRGAGLSPLRHGRLPRDASGRLPGLGKV